MTYLPDLNFLFKEKMVENKIKEIENNLNIQELKEKKDYKFFFKLIEFFSYKNYSF
mgnify:CR=1 FL=1